MRSFAIEAEASSNPTSRTPSPKETTLHALHCRTFSNKLPTKTTTDSLFEEGPRPGQIFKACFEKNSLKIPESKGPKLLGFVRSKNRETDSPLGLRLREKKSLNSVQAIKATKTEEEDHKDTKDTVKGKNSFSQASEPLQSRLEALEREQEELKSSIQFGDCVSVSSRKRDQTRNLKKDVILFPKISKKFNYQRNSEVEQKLLVRSEKKNSVLQTEKKRLSGFYQPCHSNPRTPSHSHFSKSVLNSEIQEDSQFSRKKLNFDPEEISHQKEADSSRQAKKQPK